MLGVIFLLLMITQASFFCHYVQKLPESKGLRELQFYKNDAMSHYFQVSWYVEIFCITREKHIRDHKDISHQSYLEIRHLSVIFKELGNTLLMYLSKPLRALMSACVCSLRAYKRWKMDLI